MDVEKLTAEARIWSLSVTARRCFKRKIEEYSGGRGAGG